MFTSRSQRLRPTLFRYDYLKSQSSTIIQLFQAVASIGSFQLYYELLFVFQHRSLFSVSIATLISDIHGGLSFRSLSFCHQKHSFSFVNVLYEHQLTVFISFQIKFNRSYEYYREIGDITSDQVSHISSRFSKLTRTLTVDHHSPRRTMHLSAMLLFSRGKRRMSEFQGERQINQLGYVTLEAANVRLTARSAAVSRKEISFVGYIYYVGGIVVSCIVSV